MIDNGPTRALNTSDAGHSFLCRSAFGCAPAYGSVEFVDTTLTRHLPFSSLTLASGPCRATICRALRRCALADE